MEARKGGADLKLADGAAGSLEAFQAFQAPCVCLWETAPPLPPDRTQWRQFYSDKESVRSQREREREHVSPPAMRKPCYTVSGLPSHRQQRNDAAPFSSLPNVGTLLFIEVSTSTTTATYFGKFLKVLTITCCRDC